VSVLDGWWCEGYSPEAGWAIGNGEEYDDYEFQDATESMALYNVLENEVIPLFYDRPKGDVPMRWAEMMKGSVRKGLSFFTSHRMVSEYDSRYYRTALADYERLGGSQGAAVRQMVDQHERLQTLWPDIRLESPTTSRDVSLLHVGNTFEVTTNVQLGKLRPEDVEVQVYYGPVNSENRIVESLAEAMKAVETRADGVSVYKCELTCKSTGRYGFTARVVPRGKDWSGVMPGFITWADEFDA
jgi:starch phosphorylase